MTAATLTARARREVAAAADWIARDNPVAATRFRNALVASAERIGAYPQIGARRPELARGSYRFIAMTGYPYLIVYADDRVPPVIARVVHTARDLPRILRDLE